MISRRDVLKRTTLVAALVIVPLRL
ncbi:twin-arginine translocation signal domain-containing protein [uncultured Brevibacillus sp.]